MVHGDILSDLRRFSDDHPHSMVKEESGTDLRSWMDLDPREKSGNMREKAGKKIEVTFPEPMGKPVGIEGMKTRIAEEHFEHAPGSRISIEN
jgi:hypothetical protein